MVNIPLARIWLVVKPTVGLPIFFISVAVVSLLIHYAVLLHTTWYPAYYNGRSRPPAPVVGLLVPGPTTPGTTLPG